MTLLNSVVDLLYPPICPICEGVADKTRQICDHCVSEMEPIDAQVRCPRCFSKEYSRQKNCCGNCIRRPPLMNRMGAVFEYQKTASYMVRSLKYQNQPHLVKGMAAFLVYQWEALEYPLPDVVLPVPITRPRKLIRGYNQAFLLAKELAGYLRVPVIDPTKRFIGSSSQAGLSRRQRMKMGHQLIKLKEAKVIRGKSCLVIDDVMTTGMTMRRTAEALLEGFPKALYGLTFAQA